MHIDGTGQGWYINNTQVLSTAAELNLLDGVTTAVHTAESSGLKITSGKVNFSATKDAITHGMSSATNLRIFLCLNDSTYSELASASSGAGFRGHPVSFSWHLNTGSPTTKFDAHGWTGSGGAATLSASVDWIAIGAA
jgi:hypothetical protein